MLTSVQIDPAGQVKLYKKKKSTLRPSFGLELMALVIYVIMQRSVLTQHLEVTHHMIGIYTNPIANIIFHSVRKGWTKSTVIHLQGECLIHAILLHHSCQKMSRLSVNSATQEVRHYPKKRKVLNRRQVRQLFTTRAWKLHPFKYISMQRVMQAETTYDWGWILLEQPRMLGGVFH